MKRLTLGIGALALLLASPILGWTESESNELENPTIVSDFWDIPENHTHYDAIMSLASKGMIQGYSDGSFKSNEAINRAETLQIVANWVAADLPENAQSSFVDVPKDAWFAPAVEWGLEEKLVQGYPAGTFQPSNIINRGEALKIILHARNVVVSDPCEGCDWVQPYVEYSEANQLFTVYPDGEVHPEVPVSRGELAEALYRLDNPLYEGPAEHGIATYYGYSYDGANTASGTPLQAYGYQAAHKTLPFGSLVKVTNLDTGLSTIVEIVDRGPYGPGRVIDLTPHAFDEIGALSRGVLPVTVELLR